MKPVIASLLAGMIAAVTTPARAEGVVAEGWNAAAACIPDIEKLCGGVTPGGGRIKACIKQHIGELSPACFDDVLTLAVGLADAPTIKLNPGPVAGQEVHTPYARDYAYCEIAPIIKTESGVVAAFYNTTGTTGPTGGCPPQVFAGIVPKELASKLGAATVYMNPTPQTARRHWVMDQNWVYAVGETVDFGGVASTWMATMRPEDMLTALNTGPYQPTEIRRKSKYLYAKGSTVFLLRAPDGKVWVMQSYASEIDPSLTIDQLPNLGGKLKSLPAGWAFQAKTLDQDLTVDPRNAGGLAHIVRDELHDVYEGCGFDAACNFVP
jgi:hypothetical protein